MMNEKLTQNEQAEKQQNAMIESGLSKVPKPPKGIGAEFCEDCNEPIEQARREIAGYTNCIECAELTEMRNEK